MAGLNFVFLAISFIEIAFWFFFGSLMAAREIIPLRGRE